MGGGVGGGQYLGRWERRHQAEALSCPHAQLFPHGALSSTCSQRAPVMILSTVLADLPLEARSEGTEGTEPTHSSWRRLRSMPRWGRWLPTVQKTRGLRDRTVVVRVALARVAMVVAATPVAVALLLLNLICGRWRGTSKEMITALHPPNLPRSLSPPAQPPLLPHPQTHSPPLPRPSSTIPPRPLRSRPHRTRLTPVVRGKPGKPRRSNVSNIHSSTTKPPWRRSCPVGRMGRMGG